MRGFLAGASGTLGRPLCRQLMEAGDRARHRSLRCQGSRRRPRRRSALVRKSDARRTSQPTRGSDAVVLAEEQSPPVEDQVEVLAPGATGVVGGVGARPRCGRRPGAARSAGACPGPRGGAPTLRPRRTSSKIREAGRGSWYSTTDRSVASLRPKTKCHDVLALDLGRQLEEGVAQPADDGLTVLLDVHRLQEPGVREREVPGADERVEPLQRRIAHAAPSSPTWSSPSEARVPIAHRALAAGKGGARDRVRRTGAGPSDENRSSIPLCQVAWLPVRGSATAPGAAS